MGWATIGFLGPLDFGVWGRRAGAHSNSKRFLSGQRADIVQSEQKQMKPASFKARISRSEFIKHMLFRLFNILHNSLTIVSRNLPQSLAIFKIYSYSNCNYNYLISFCSDCTIVQEEARIKRERRGLSRAS